MAYSATTWVCDALVLLARSLHGQLGLGKTIQVISFLCAIMGEWIVQSCDDASDDEAGHKCLPTEENRRLEISKESLADVEYATDLGPTALVVAPASVTENWKREIETVRKEVRRATSAEMTF